MPRGPRRCGVRRSAPAAGAAAPMTAPVGRRRGARVGEAWLLRAVTLTVGVEYSHGGRGVLS
eukprot:5336851-Prymnesium_polylepis.1